METYYSKEEIIEAGLDEAGRGSLAGPVFAGAVIWPRDLDPDIEHPKLNDSKKLSKKRREFLRNYRGECYRLCGWFVYTTRN